MTRDPASFERLYRDRPDPWNYETSPAEADKYRRSLALLRGRRFARALEVGCSIGVMSALIARQCDSLLALDCAPTALDRARARGIANARFEPAVVPQDWPAGQWDLIVLSEVLYYLSSEALDRTVAQAAGALAPGGACLVVGYGGDTQTDVSAAESMTRALVALAGSRGAYALWCDRGPDWSAWAFHCRSGE